MGSTVLMPSIVFSRTGHTDPKAISVTRIDDPVPSKIKNTGINAGLGMVLKKSMAGVRKSAAPLTLPINVPKATPNATANAHPASKRPTLGMTSRNVASVSPP